MPRVTERRLRGKGLTLGAADLQGQQLSAIYRQHRQWLGQHVPVEGVGAAHCVTRVEERACEWGCLKHRGADRWALSSACRRSTGREFRVPFSEHLPRPDSHRAFVCLQAMWPRGWEQGCVDRVGGEGHWLSRSPR